jgi:RNA polymerase sigma-70 factor (ECF subfamily)
VIISDLLDAIRAERLRFCKVTLSQTRETAVRKIERRVRLAGDLWLACLERSSLMIAPWRGYSNACIEPSEADEDFLRLLTQARAGSSEALGQLFAAQGSVLLAVARRNLDHRLGVKLAPEDLVQETFLEAQLCLDQFRGWRQVEFAAWLRAVLLNRLANGLRRFRRTKRRSLDRELPQAAVESAIAAAPDPHAAPNVEAEAREISLRLSAGMRGMAPLVRAVLIERACQDATFREIGLRHDCSPKVARRHWVQGLRELQRHMKAAGGEGGAARNV